MTGLIDWFRQNVIKNRLGNITFSLDKGWKTQGTLVFLPADPKARWYLLSGLNFTQHTLALASIQDTECSMPVDHNLTVKD